ncbi:MAG: hypothetical protein KatS3mg105_4056 [Gemmatales bacterium]|nr:MAG: hypothetical protein KatS3mg105_4056 [Gemmatales bacterium]
MNWLYLLPIPLLAILFLAWRPLRLFGREVQFERARELFRLQREQLEKNFLQAASTSGRPRGLIWKNCEWDRQVVFARERQSGNLAALIAVTIQFEAVPGSDMEDVPAVGNLRNASAVFFFHRGRWHTVGKAIFNMNPDEAIDHFKSQYERVGEL